MKNRWFKKAVFVAVQALFIFSFISPPAKAYTLLPDWTFWADKKADFWLQGFNAGDLTGFNSAFHEAMLLWNNQSDFLYVPLDGSDEPCDTLNNGWKFSGTLCGEAFGGNTLAVTISRRISGVKTAPIVFNTAFTWDVHNGAGNNRTVIDFRRVAAHELGHAAGLDHSLDATALMAPFYSDTTETPTTDDLDGLRAIYGGAPPTVAALPAVH